MIKISGYNEEAEENTGFGFHSIGHQKKSMRRGRFKTWNR